MGRAWGEGQQLTISVLKESSRSRGERCEKKRSFSNSVWRWELESVRIEEPRVRELQCVVDSTDLGMGLKQYRARNGTETMLAL